MDGVAEQVVVGSSTTLIDTLHEAIEKSVAVTFIEDQTDNEKVIARGV